MQNGRFVTQQEREEAIDAGRRLADGDALPAIDLTRRVLTRLAAHIRHHADEAATSLARSRAARETAPPTELEPFRARHARIVNGDGDPPRPRAEGDCGR